MTQTSPAMDFGKTLHCLEVFRAVQTDSRTAGWYWGDVRGKAAIGAATNALLRRALIHAVVGPPPFALTPKGVALLETHKEAWAAFFTNADRHGSVAHFAMVLGQISEEDDTRDAH
jgi:hypothetical protein